MTFPRRTLSQNVSIDKFRIMKEETPYPKFQINPFMNSELKNSVYRIAPLAARTDNPPTTTIEYGRPGFADVRARRFHEFK